MDEQLTKRSIEQALEELESADAGCAVIPLPAPLSVVDLDAWGREEAAALAEVGAIRNDGRTVEVVGVLLATVAQLPVPDDFSWRFALVPGPNEPILTVVVGFSPAVGDEDTAFSLMLDGADSAALSVDVADFDLDGRKGRHCLRFAVRDPQTGAEAADGEVWVTAGVVCRRELPGAGLVDVLAVLDTPYVGPGLASVATIYEIVTGDYLADAVAGALARR